MDKRDLIWSRLSLVIEPELGLPLTDLGLVYDVTLDESGRDATIIMTLTSPMCPLAPEILRMVEEAVRDVDGLDSVHVEVVFDPPWDPYTMATEEAQDALGLDEARGSAIAPAQDHGSVLPRDREAPDDEVPCVSPRPRTGG